MEKYWKIRNMLVWHLPNRNQGFAASHKFFSKHDIAMVGTSANHEGLNIQDEEKRELMGCFESKVAVKDKKLSLTNFNKKTL